MKVIERLMMVGFLVMAPNLLRAATYYWDGNGSGVVGGGTGNWDGTLLRWCSTSDGSTYVAWPGAGNEAVFQNTAGTVTFSWTSGTTLTCDVVTVNSPGYVFEYYANRTLRLEGSNTWGGTAIGGVVLRGVSDGQNLKFDVPTYAEIPSIFTDPAAGGVSLLTKAGSGTLVLSGSNTLNGAIALSAGTLCVTKYLGTNTVTAENGTTFEIRSDQNAVFSNSYAANGVNAICTLFAGRAAGGTGSNGTHSLWALKVGTQTQVINGEYGYGLSFGSTVLQYSPVISNAAPGLVSLGDVSYTGGSGTRTAVFMGSGNTRMGTFTNTTAIPLTLQKDGTGQLTLNGPGNWNVVTLNAGSLLAGNVGALGTSTVTMAKGGILRAGTGVTCTNVLAGKTGGFGGNGTITANGVKINTTTNGILDPGNATNLIGKVTLSSGILFTNSNCQYIWQLGTLSDQNPGVDYDQVSVGAGSSFTNSTVVLDLSLLPLADQPNASPQKSFWRQARTWTILDGATDWPRYLTGAYTNGFSLITNKLVWTPSQPFVKGTTITLE